MWLQLHDRQAGYALEVAEIGRAYVVAEFEGGHADEQIGKSNSHSSRLILAIDFSRAEGQGHGDRMNGHCRLQLFDELLPLCFSLGRIRPGRSVGQFDQGNHADGDFCFRDCLREGGEHLPGVLAPPLGGNEHAGVED